MDAEASSSPAAAAGDDETGAANAGAARSCETSTSSCPSSCTLRHQSALQLSATASATLARIHGQAVAARYGGGSAGESGGGGGSASSSSARTSAVMRSVWVSTPATSARRSSAKCSRSVL